MPIRNVSKRELCPICGKSDWCTILSKSSSEVFEELNICRRSGISSDVLSHINGLRYSFIKELSDGSLMFEETQMHEAAKKAWIQRQGKKVSRCLHQTLTNDALQSMQPIPTEEKKIIHGCAEPLGHDQLNRIYTSFLNKLPLYSNHRNYLRSEGWKDTLINRSCIRSIPTGRNLAYVGAKRIQITRELIKEFGSVRGVPGFYLQKDDNWCFTARASGILIPVFDCKGRIYRLRIRLDYPERDINGKEKNKYNNFSSFYEASDDNNELFNGFTEGCRSGNHIGFYCQDKDDFTVCYVTEGEKKALFANDVLHCPVVSIPGVNSFMKLLEPLEDGSHVLDYLKARGCCVIVIAYDADKAVNQTVLRCEKKLVSLVNQFDFQIALAEWNMGFGKGLDDILSVGVRPNYSIAVL